MPPPQIPGSGSSDWAVAWVIGSSLLAICGGGWMGFAAEADGVTAGVGAFLMMAAMFLAIAAANQVGLMLGVAMLGQRGLQMLRRTRPTTPDRRAGRDQRDDRRMRWWMSAAGACTLLVLAPVVAMIVWIIAVDASLMGTIGRSWLIALLLAMALPRALPALDEVQFGGPAP